MDRQLGPKLVAEFIGTFALIFMGAGAIIVGSGLIGIALAHGLTIALMITAMGHVSGGAFNPAVAIGLWATRRLSNIEVVGYILAELAGGIAGAAALLLFPEALRDVANGVPTIAGVTFVQGAVIGRS
jgi:glycerol uptake facilitator-like aquaporin